MLIYKTIYIDDFHLYEKELTMLYLASFSHGSESEFISELDAKLALQSTLNKGAGIVVISDKQLVGLILFHSLALDDDFSAKQLTNSLYIAEVMVDKNYRGKGIAKQMLEKVEMLAISDRFKSLSLRVWDENTAALSLYKKMNFVEIGIDISQMKYKEDKTPFSMRKIYLLKELE